jgi:amidase
LNTNTPSISFTGPQLCRLPAREVVRLLKLGEVSPTELLDAALERIRQVEPVVNALPTICEDRARLALGNLARDEVANSNEPSWLAGLPIAIKDLTAVAGVRTTFGTKGLADFVPDESDPLVELLESRGGIVVGKTNTPEFGAGGNTFNDVFGYTRNPWDTRKNAGGSSGGAAVSLAAGEVWLSHGSDLAGSLRTPAAYCGIVGFRPSPGRAGGGPPALGFHTEGVQGPMARDVSDCALFLDAMTGFNSRCPISVPAPEIPFQEAVKRIDVKVRIAYSPDLNGFSPVSGTIDRVLRAALEAVVREGGIVEEACPELPGLDRIYRILRAMLWAAGPGRAPEEIQRHYKDTLADNIDFGRKLSIDDVYDAQLGRTVLYNNMHEFLGDYDVLACPTVGLEATSVEEEYPKELDGKPLTDYIEWLRFSYLSTATSLPSISILAGFTEKKMPAGLQLIGPPRGEAKLLQVARAVEEAVGVPKTPIDPVVRHEAVR